MMKKFFVALTCVVVGLVSATVASAQILTFEFSTALGSEVTTNSNFNDVNLTSSTLSRGAGLTASANAGRFNAISWAVTNIANAVAGNDYMEFTITPQPGYQFSVSNIYIQFQRSSTGNRGMTLRSSLDSYASDIGSEWVIDDITTTTNHTWTFAQSNSTSAVTYRFYSWAETTAGSGGIGDGAGNDIIVGGTVTSSGGAPTTNIAFTASSAAVDENAGTYVVTVTKSLASGNVSGQVDLSGSATYGAGSDYTLNTTNFTMNASTTSATFTVTINDDSDTEAAETILLTITNVIGGSIASPSAFTLTINPSDAGAPAVWINEINYDPTGTDSNEFVEVAGSAGINLANYTLFRYESDGTIDGTHPLSGTIDDEDCGVGAVEFLIAGIENGPDGLALANVSGGVTTLVQFLSYESSFAGTAGPASGYTSENVGTQPGTDLMTLQLSGYATNYIGFTWVLTNSSQGTLNIDQTIDCTPPSNSPPVLASIGNKSGTSDEALNFSVIATPTDGDTVTLTVSNAPSGSTFSSTNENGSFNWASPTIGVYTSTFYAADKDGVDSETIVITISANVPPILGSIGNKSAILSNAVNFAVTATPTDGDTVTLTASNLPSGATFSSTNENGSFSWSPAQPIGVYTMSFYAADTGGVDSETITITVGAQPSSFTLLAGNLGAQTGPATSYYEPYAERILRGLKPDIACLQEWDYTNGTIAQFVATNFGSSFEYYREEGATLPSGIVSRWPIVDSGILEDTEIATRDFPWVTLSIPGCAPVHVISVHVKAGTLAADIATREIEASIITNFIATTFPTSDYVVVAGDFNLTDRTESSLLIYTNILLKDNHQPADQDDDKTTNVSRDEVYDLILPNGSLNANHATLTVGALSFPEGMVFDSRLWSPPPSPILTNDSAEVNMVHLALMKRFTFTYAEQPPIITRIGDQSVMVGADIGFAVTATPTDGDSVSLTASNLPSGATFSSTNENGWFSWPNASPIGSYTTTFYAVDNDGSYAEPVVITLLPVPDVIISEVADPSDIYQARFVEIYSAVSNIDFAAAGWYLSIQVNGGTWSDIALTGTVAAGDTYVVSYNTGDFVSAYGFAPDQYSGNISGNGDDAYALFIGGNSADGTLVDIYGVVNQDGTGMPWEYTDKQANRNPGVFTPKSTWDSNEWTIVSATTADMSPGMHGSNLPPVLASIGNKSVIESNLLQFAITATPTDSDPVTLTVSNAPAGSTFGATNENGTFTWSSPSPVGVYTMKVYAADNDGVDSETITITVSPTLPDLIISEVADPLDDLYARFIEIYNPGASPVDFSVDPFYVSRQVNGGTTWYEVQLTGTVAAGGTYLIANNATSFLARYGFDADIVISGSTAGNGDDACMLYGYGGHASGTLIDIYGVLNEDGTGMAWDYEDKHATRSLSVTQPNTTWTSSEWTIVSGNVVDMTPGVHGYNQPPTITPVSDKFLVLSNALSFDVIAQDLVDGDTVSLWATGIPSGASFPSNSALGAITNTFSWPSVSPVGVYTTTFWAADDDGTRSETVVITVYAPAPELMISEVADPLDNSLARFVEIYNPGVSSVDLSANTYYLSRQVNGGATWQDVQLTGTLAAGSTYVLANSTSSFLAAYGFLPNAEFGGSVDYGNGDDAYILYASGNHTSGSIMDIYGIVDQDGTGMPWDYADDQATRLLTVTHPNATWDSNEWSFVRDVLVANTTPGAHGPNQKPSLATIGNKIVIDGNSLGFSVVAQDLIDSDSVTLWAENLPSGASFPSNTAAGSITGAFAWASATPTGVYTSRFYASDKDGTDFEDVVISVVAAPVDLIISEVADPVDNSNARFVEIYNPGVSAVDLSSNVFWMGRQSSGGTSWDQIQLTGTVAAGSTYVLANSPADFQAAYGFAPDADMPGITGNGDDAYVLFAFGDHTAGAVVDIYGVLDQSGLGQTWEYTDSQAARLTSVTSPNATWTLAEWTITTNATTLSMTPGYHGTNMPPVLGEIGSKVVMVSNLLTFAVSATATDGDTVTLSVSNAPAGSTFGSTNENGTFTWSSAAPVGIYTMTVYATDNDGVDMEPVLITVSPDSDIIISELLMDPVASLDAVGEWIELYNDGWTDVDIDGWIVSDGASVNNVISNGAPLMVPAKGFLVLGRSTDTGTNGNLTVNYAYSTFTMGNTADSVILKNNMGAEVARVDYDDGVVFPATPAGASLYLKSPSLNPADGANWAISTLPWPGSWGDLGTPGAMNDTGVWGTNVPPVLDLVADQALYENDLLQVMVSATPTDADTVTLSLSNAPAGMTISATNENGTINWVATPVGVYTTQVYATDKDGSDIEEFVVTVNPNTPPNLWTINNKEVVVNEVLVFSVNASPTEGDLVTLSASNLPAGASFTSSNEYGQFTWSNASPVGVYTSTFYAADDDGVDFQDVIITVSLKPTSGSTVVFYDFDDGLGGFMVGADTTAANVLSGDFTTSDAVFTNGSGKIGYAVNENGWTEAGHYFEFSLTVSDGYAMAVDSLTFYDYHSANGPSNWYFRYSGDAYSADLCSGAAHTNIADGYNDTVVSLTNLTGVQTFRLYGIGAIASSGTWRVDSVHLLGSVTSTGGVADADADGMDDSWEIANFGNTTTAGIGTDYDGDLFFDTDEFGAGTQPTNILSLLKINSGAQLVGGAKVIKWASVAGKEYMLLRSTDVSVPFVGIASNIMATTPENVYTDAAAPAVERLLYRIQIDQP
ncbi:MAG: lamin tail domain-containing protein [Kiritimatiellia bacterium]